MEILSEEAIGVINGYLQVHENKTQAEEEKASAINELVNATINNADLNNLFEAYKEKKSNFQSTVFPRKDIQTHHEYIHDSILKDNNSSPPIELSLGITGPVYIGFQHGDKFGFYLSSALHQNHSRFTHFIPDRIQKMFSWDYNNILLEPEEVVPILKAIIEDRTYVFELPNPDVFGDGLEKSVGKAINYITGS